MAEFSFDRSRGSVSGARLDASTRMSAEFRVNVNTERAARDFATIEDALARLQALGKQSGTRPGANRGAPMRTSGRTGGTGRRGGGGKFDNGPILVFQAKVMARVEGKTEQAMIDAMKTGQMLVKIDVESAVTGWGLYRMSRGQGRGPGREDSGAMVDAVTWNVTKQVAQSRLARTNNKLTLTGGFKNVTFTGYFGWDKPTTYQVAQEKGFKHARGSSGGFERAIMKGPRSTRTSAVYVQGALSLGNSMVASRQRLQGNLERM